MRKKWHLRNAWSWLKSSHFETEARAHASIIPVLSRQLTETIGSIESSAGEVCASFGQMATLARTAAGMGAALVQENGSPTVSGTIQDCRAMLAHLSNRLEHSGNTYARAIHQMETTSGAVRRIFTVLQELDQASFASRIIALNAKIEAVHLGALGSGFEVVAEQISSQSARSTELTASVVTVLKNLTGAMDSATAELKELAETDRAEANRSREEASQTLAKLEQASARMQETVSETCKASETLYVQISRAIVNMQFQDRVSQRLGHVIDSLDAMGRAFAEPEHAPPHSNATVEERKRQIAEELAATYTMPSERVAHEDNTLAPSATAQTDLSGDVELF